MKKLSSLKSSLLMSSVALSVLSSSVNAVSKEVVRAYWLENSDERFSLDSEILDNLVKFDEAQWEKFKSTAQPLMTKDMVQWDRANVIHMLGQIDPVKLFHEKFVTTASSLMTKGMSGYHRAWVIGALGKVAYDTLFHEKFVTTASSLITENMNGEVRAHVIEALGKVDPKKWGDFKKIAEALMTIDMTGLHRTLVIDALGNLDAEQWEQFKTILGSLITNNMLGKNRVLVIEALGRMKPEKWDDFKTIAKFLTNGMDKWHCAEVIPTLANVPADKIECVYGQIQRLMQQTQGKINLVLAPTATKLIYQLCELTSEDQAKVFTDDLIDCVNRTVIIDPTNPVNGAQGNVDDNTLLTHIRGAWDEVKTLSNEELQKRSNSRVSSAQLPVDSQDTDILRPNPTHTPMEEGLGGTTPAGSSDLQENEPALRRGLAPFPSAKEETAQ